MWSYLTLLLICFGAAVAVGNHDHAWETNNEYQFNVRTRTFTCVDKVNNQFSGIVIKAVFTVQVISPEVVRAMITNPRYTHVHTVIPEGWEGEIPDNQLEYRDLSISDKPFEILYKHGIVRDVRVEQGVPIWEINLIKSIVSQIQIDTQGENIVSTSSAHIPTEEDPDGMFTVVEDSVGGRCQVNYEIKPLSETARHANPEMVPMSHVHYNGQHIDIIKTKDYDSCIEQSEYHFGLDGTGRDRRWGNYQGFISKFSISRVVISGNVKRYVIQSSVTTNQIYVSPDMNNNYIGAVYSKVNITLNEKREISKPTLNPSSNFVSTGDLVYIYNNPFSDHEQFSVRHPSISRGSMPDQSSEGSDSSNEERQRIWRYGQRDSDSSSSNNDANTWKQHEYRHQHRPQMHEAPENPMMPMFIGFKGKNIQKSDKVELVSEATRLIMEIVKEIQRTQYLTQATLEKFTLVIQLIRLMNVQQITELQKCNGNIQENVHSRAETRKHGNENSPRYERFRQSGEETFGDACWQVIRDAVTHAGTGPAFVTVKKWITEGKVKNWQAARVISIIPKVARTPTPEYIEEFFELIKEPTVLEQEFLNSTALFAFAELVHNAQISKTISVNRYPVFTYGPMIPHNNHQAFTNYISFMGKQMKEAIENNDSVKAQAYILAVGKFCHPQIISIFEPYIEGTLPVSTYQRQVMVSALAGLTTTVPNVVRPILFKIYANPEEAHEIRCVAVYILMMTNPPLDMLQRMAQFTKYERNIHVNSAVKDIIKNFAKLNGPQWQELSEKARIASKQLTNKVFDYEYSHSYIGKTDFGLYIINNIFNAHTVTYNTVGSSDSKWHKAAYLQYPTEFVFGYPNTQLMYMVSSIKQFFDSWVRQREQQETPTHQGQHGQGRSHVDEIIRAIGIQPLEPDPLEGLFMVNHMYGSQIYTFDDQIIQKILKMNQGSGQKQQQNMIFLHNYDVTVSFPVESGLPFTYSVEKPVMIKLYVSNIANQDSEVDSHKEVKNEINIVCVANMIDTFSVVTPFDYQHYYAGINKNVQVVVPIAYNFKVDRSEGTAQLRIRPNLQAGTLSTSETKDKSKYVHYSVVPFTGKTSVLDVEPISVNKNTRVVHKFTQQESQFNYNSFVVHVKSDVEDEENWYAIIKQIIESNEYDSTYKQIDLYMKTDNAINDGIIINTAYGHTDVNTHVRQGQYENSWPVDMTDFPTTLPKDASNEERRDRMMERVSKDTQFNNVRAVDVTVEIPYTKEKYIGTFGEASHANHKTQRFFFFQTVKNDVTNYQVCAAGHVHSSETKHSFNFENAVAVVPEDQYHAEIQFGSTCVNGHKFFVNGTWTRSPDLEKAIVKSNIANKCKREMQEGNKAMQACQKAIALAEVKNHMQVSVNYPETIFPIINEAVFSKFGVNVQNCPSEKISGMYKSENWKTTNVDIKIMPDFKNVKIGMGIGFPHTQFDVDFPPIDFSGVMNREADRIWNEEEGEARCTIDRTQAITFDNKQYPVKIGNCQHVMMTTFIPQNSVNPFRPADIPEKQRIAIIVREDDNHVKRIQTIIGDDEIDFHKKDDHFEVKINNKKIERISGFRYVKDNEPIVEITERPDQSIEIRSDKYNMIITYDGERIQVQVTGDFHDGIRGLCGNNDGDPDNDFVTPRNCIISRPEEFSAMWAVTKDDCEGPAVENKRRAEHAKCEVPSNRQSNVITDRQAGRFTKPENRFWGYHVKNEARDKSPAGPSSKHCTHYRTMIIEDDNEICMTIRPLPKCKENCKPVEKKTKRIPIHCTPRNEVSIQMKRRIEQGANPDMSLRSISKMQSIEVPIACTAA